MIHVRPFTLPFYSFSFETTKDTAGCRALYRNYIVGGDSLNYIAVNSNDDNYSYALAGAQSLVKDFLKSPSSAKFPWDYSQYSVVRNGDKWMVGGSVESQNGFGAMIKTNWIATFTMEEPRGSAYKISDYDVVFY